jgi:hypothetical protein
VDFFGATKTSRGSPLEQSTASCSHVKSRLSDSSLAMIVAHAADLRKKRIFLIWPLISQPTRGRSVIFTGLMIQTGRRLFF